MNLEIKYDVIQDSTNLYTFTQITCNDPPDNP